MVILYLSYQAILLTTLYQQNLVEILLVLYLDKKRPSMMQEIDLRSLDLSVIVKNWTFNINFWLLQHDYKAYK